MRSTDKNCFLERAAKEIVIAQQSDNVRAATAHFDLAGLYLDWAREGHEDKDLDRLIGAAAASMAAER